MRRELLCAAILALGFICAAPAQVPQGAILGTVMDPSSAAVGDAEVTLENQLTGIRSSIKSTAEGMYVFDYLESGLYRVTVKASGFKTAVYPNIAVQLGQRVRVDARLVLGDVTTAIEVTGASALVETDSAVLGSLISRREALDMPVRGREFSQLALLLPGVRSSGTTGGAIGAQFATGLAVGGTDSGKVNYTMDGVDNFMHTFNGPAMNPSMDSIQELRIDKSQFSAEFGRGGAQLHVVTKAGTNEFHGMAWDYLRNKALNAGNYISHQQDTLRRNQFGANLGNPIRKNKLFSFFNWESQRERSSAQQLGTVMTEAMRSGDFRGYPKTVRDPLNGQPFPNAVIPASRFNPVSIALMEAMSELPNLPGFTNNYLRTSRTWNDWNQFIERVDYQLSDNDSLFIRVADQRQNSATAPGTVTSIQGTKDFAFFNMGIGWTRTWNSGLITETRFGLHRERLDTDFVKAEKLPAKMIKCFGSVQPPPERMAEITITDTSGFRRGNEYGNRRLQPEVVENVTLFRGKHLVKFGFAGRTVRTMRDRYGNLLVSATFNGTYTGTGPGDYLLGNFFSASQSLAFVLLGQDTGTYSGFFQDDWKVTNSLTLNIGLRYEINTVTKSRLDRWGNFSPELQKIVLAGDKIDLTGVPDPYVLQSYEKFLVPAAQAGVKLPLRTLVFGDHNNFGPRFGFAWRPFHDNKTVVRGGYGVYYLLEDGNIAANGFKNPPYGGSVAVNNTRPLPTLTIDDPFSTGVNALPAPSAYYRDPYMRAPYLQQLTIGIQRELPWKSVVDLNFQDQNSKKLETGWNLNEPKAGPGTLASRRPFPTFGSSIAATFHEGRARYDALEFSFRKTSKHLTLQYSHTWAKNLERESPLDPYDREASYGPGGYVPHLSKLHFIADLPFGKGRRWGNRDGLADKILGGWTLSGFAVLFQSGGPLTITWNGDPANVGRSGARPDRIASGKIEDPTMDKYFDTAAFVPPRQYTFGNSGTGILFAPSSQRFDAALQKAFVLTERTTLQFRTEWFDAFNHPNWAAPQTVANGLNFGKITTKSHSPRVIQFALRLAF